MIDYCHCGSRKPYLACCGRFLDGGEQASTPEQLMRSRYTAYALGGHGDYLLRTWFPATARGLSAEALSRRDKQWLGLKVLEASQDGDQGYVEFEARFKDAAGKAQTLHEKSVFQRLGGRWLYIGGEVNASAG
ncbi:MAG: YchJ family metal-binding protein [Pseudomonadota bacterium]